MKLEYDAGHIEFKPIKITLVIESRDELMELWHRLDLAFSEVKNISNKEIYFPKEHCFMGLWRFLNKTAIDRGIKYNIDEE